MKRKNIGILTDQFINWGGGIDFIRLILNGLSSVSKYSENNVNIVVFIPRKSTAILKIKNLVKSFLNLFVKTKFQRQNAISESYFLDLFQSFSNKIQVVFYDGSEGELIRNAKIYHIDLILPAFNPLDEKFPIPWTGYIYDFQHRYYPEFFSKEEIKRRDAQFLLMVNRAETVIVNANSVKSDIDKFIVDYHSKITVLPFCPVLHSNFFTNNVDIQKYNLPKKYFLISNQFWKHKNHSVAFMAFRLFLDKVSNKSVELICTGQTHDDRFPNYYQELLKLIQELRLENSVKILGYIKKEEQLAILKGCVAVVQPTLFEGGPGGGAVYESVAYGIPSIVSNIPVNKEIEDETVTFFDVESPQDLAIKMENVFYAIHPDYSRTYLETKNQKSLENMGKKIIELLDYQ